MEFILRLHSSLITSEGWHTKVASRAKCPVKSVLTGCLKTQEIYSLIVMGVGRAFHRKHRKHWACGPELGPNKMASLVLFLAFSWVLWCSRWALSLLWWFLGFCALVWLPKVSFVLNKHLVDLFYTLFIPLVLSKASKLWHFSLFISRTEKGKKLICIEDVHARSFLYISSFTRTIFWGEYYCN